MSKVREPSGDVLHLALVRHITRHCMPPSVAAIGVLPPREVRAMCNAIARQCRRHKVTSARRIWLFHDGDIVFEQDTLEGLAEKERRPKAWAKAPRDPLIVPFEQMVKFSHETEWQQDIANLTTAGAEPFGLVCHYGRGTARAIRDHIEALTPLLADTTLVVMHRTHQGGAGTAFDTMVQDGWNGVELGTLGLLQRSRHP